MWKPLQPTERCYLLLVTFHSPPTSYIGWQDVVSAANLILPFSVFLGLLQSNTGFVVLFWFWLLRGDSQLFYLPTWCLYLHLPLFSKISQCCCHHSSSSCGSNSKCAKVGQLLLFSPLYLTLLKAGPNDMLVKKTHQQPAYLSIPMSRAFTLVAEKLMEKS